MSRARPTRTIRSLAVILVAFALAACGSTINRPLQVAAEQGGGSGGTGTSVVGSGTDGGTGTDGSIGSATDGGATGGAGTGTGGTSAPGGATATTAAPAATGAVKTGPVEVGFYLARASNAAAFGGSLPELVDQRDIVNAAVRSQNKKGGLHGRKIVPVFEETDTASNNTEADVGAACATFTEDHQVEAVAGRISDLFDSMETCLAKRQIPHIAGSPEAKDERFIQQYPGLFNVASLSFEQRTRLKVDYGMQAGILTPQDKIGVVFAGCPSSLRSWEQDAAPYMKSKGLNVASVFYTRCPAGANDAITEVGKIGNLILQFRSAGVNKLYFHDSETACIFIIANAAEAQGWRPTYYVSTLANMAVTGTQIPKAQAANVVGIGWSPASDVQKAQWPAPNPAAARCLAELKAEGVVPQTPLDHINAFFTCDTLSLLAEAVDAAGGRIDAPSVAAAIRGLGTKHQSAYAYDGTSSYKADKSEGIASAYPFKWDTGCACFKYGGAKVAVPGA